jgi:integrase
MCYNGCECFGKTATNWPPNPAPRPIMHSFTDRELQRAKPGPKDRWLSEGLRTHGIGRLCVRISVRNAKHFYFRYTDPTRKRVKLPIGQYDPTGVDGITLDAARAHTASWNKLLRDPTTGDLKRFLARQPTRIGDTPTAASAHQQAEDDSLRALLDHYVAHLVHLKKESAYDVANQFKNHVYTPRPDLAARPAASITTDEFVTVLRVVVFGPDPKKHPELGHGRTGAKLRSSLRAAYALAIASAADPALPESVTKFGVRTNPLASIGAMGHFTVPLTRELNSSELGHFWARLGKRDGVIANTLKIALLLGGQRLAQLVRLVVKDVNLVNGTLQLYDIKGRRKTPREHLLPITAPIRCLLAPLVERSRAANCARVFTTTLKVAVRPETLSDLLNEICVEMLAAEETDSKFELRDLRRTAETRMAQQLGILPHIRAQLQSHDLGGVQLKHYDKWTYIDEKRDALEKWAIKLDQWQAEAMAKPAVAPPLSTGVVIPFTRKLAVPRAGSVSR